MKKYLIFLAALSLIVSCGKEKDNPGLTIKDNIIYDKETNKPYTGNIKGKAGENFIEYGVVNGKKEGEFLIKDKNGSLIMIGKTENNLNIGEWKYYYPNGSLESKGHFIENSPGGKWIYYYENGSIKEEGLFKLGSRIGEWNFYSESGELDSIKEFLESAQPEQNQ